MSSIQGKSGWRGTRGGLLVLLAAIGWGGVGGWAQSVPRIPAQSQVTPLPQPPLPAAIESPDPNLIAPAAPNNYLIGANDLLSVYVYQVPEMTREVMVDHSGEIELPFLPNHPISAAGQTALQVGHEVAAALVGSGLLRAPQVQVIVRQVLSKPIVMTGAVVTPQTLQASRPMSLLEALSRVEGLSQSAGDWATISSLDQPNAPMQRVALAPLLRGDEGAVNPILDGGEIVRVAPAGQVVVVGALHQPGAFLLETGHPITVLGAVALAHGIQQPASLSKAQILRRQPDGSVSSQLINLDQVFKHRIPDPSLQTGDILYVPASGARSLLNAILQDAGQATAIAIGYH